MLFLSNHNSPQLERLEIGYVREILLVAEVRKTIGGYITT